MSNIRTIREVSSRKKKKKKNPNANIEENLKSDFRIEFESLNF